VRVLEANGYQDEIFNNLSSAHASIPLTPRLLHRLCGKPQSDSAPTGQDNWETAPLIVSRGSDSPLKGRGTVGITYTRLSLEIDQQEEISLMKSTFMAETIIAEQRLYQMAFGRKTDCTFFFGIVPRC
jgi:hypothetical protein